MSQKAPSKIIKYALEKWGKKEASKLKEFFEKIDDSIKKIDSHNFNPENEPSRDSDNYGLL